MYLDKLSIPADKREQAIRAYHKPPSGNKFLEPYPKHPLTLSIAEREALTYLGYTIAPIYDLVSINDRWGLAACCLVLHHHATIEKVLLAFENEKMAEDLSLPPRATHIVRGRDNLDVAQISSAIITLHEGKLTDGFFGDSYHDVLFYQGKWGGVQYFADHAKLTVWCNTSQDRETRVIGEGYHCEYLCGRLSLVYRDEPQTYAEWMSDMGISTTPSGDNNSANENEAKFEDPATERDTGVAGASSPDEGFDAGPE